MTIREMRSAIAKVYPGEGWKRKVANMYEDQVMAVYFKFEKEHRFDKPIEQKPNKKLNEPVQLTIWDFIK